eukprot:TRINITY_DN75279_c0_g1_i1.p1 TRINITY_DN75279_c0_g1~~TRINITY_DN75279_c0_g1_i1.p1  ORF type:complete len:427 (+),score=94.15 TRINITY_DN75279_c0_g1_i1:61-1341(+)
MPAGDDFEEGEDGTDEDDDLLEGPPRRASVRTLSILAASGVAVIALVACVAMLTSRVPERSEPGQPALGEADTDSSPQLTTSSPSTGSPNPAVTEAPPTYGVPGRATLYCFALMLPFGHEPPLIKAQLSRNTSLFACDAHTVFSNITYMLAEAVTTSVVPGGPLLVKYNTWTWAEVGVSLALNTDVFLRVWKAVFALGTFRNYDFTVKVDPDTVFFPDRLRQLMLWARAVPSLSPSRPAGTCVNCTKSGSEDESCSQHAQWAQKKEGQSCDVALDTIARMPPTDCGCDCDTKVCTSPEAVYVKNCCCNMDNPDAPQLPAIHGPIEVISRQAAMLYEEGMDTCKTKLADSLGQYGEDWFLQHCLDLLGANPIHEYKTMVDQGCGNNPWPCTASNAAFTPFKDLDGYLACLKNAEEQGVWPPPNMPSR